MSGFGRFPEAYVEYLIEFHSTRDYFECHEILEAYWKEQEGDEHRDVWHGLIQVAVGLYHHRIGKLKGALKMFDSAKDRLATQDISALSLDRAQLFHLLDERTAHLEGNQATSFSDFNLPLTDPQLLEHCQSLSIARGLQWGQASNLSDMALTFRHKLRDRSDVIEARALAILNKNRR